ncbi:Beta-glucosidase cel3A [Datura stramonium]|uniref:Endoglucanase n=1 Tax=Datura stramonium TaxID=4076 RepID=A0ABS8V4J7_DATST|nr:Beta-glucosidase cel3A [Datura stramonium]
MSYMVGYGKNYPRRVHHRGSSLPSLAMHPQSFGCDGGFQPFYYTANANPNILIGAVKLEVLIKSDFFPDERTDYSHSEPATYINAAIDGKPLFDKELVINGMGCGTPIVAIIRSWRSRTGSYGANTSHKIGYDRGQES